MWRLASRSGFIAGAVGLALSAPSRGTAQLPGDSVLLSLPRDSAVTCEGDSDLAGRGAPPGTRAYTFRVGALKDVIRDATGRVFFPGMPPREISVAFDSAGRPVMLVDEADITQWRKGTAVVYFPAGDGAFGFRQIVQTDSAAVMAQVRREGLGALNGAVRQATLMGPQEPLDSLTVERARDLATRLWPKRCPVHHAGG
jgi:hypothetical protein